MIYYISGGARSGKSSYAMELAKSLSEKPVYLATARKWDDDFEERIQRHKDERGEDWQSLEKETNLHDLDLSQKVVVIDCITLWLTNYWVDSAYDIDACLKSFKEDFDQLVTQKATFIFISNEIGMGLHPIEEGTRKFVDLQGWANQHVAKNADQAIFMVSGLPMKVK
ncbi:bifunctional adenosylcobinamide kinase/adenosylcobinamide-phosphate guanylyltransferase [Reichenbachiella versicolor]|uniref:bifunctional adenosylcobinamide kinase/adenosylcobinamide-phosphate guanylyltransferase n=1 Tax=Reichenbachiella versicolor TaxID=1821036 RepID=UPI000D6DC60C|nr:bifunctional adenosylcobinamide kinase/adenosylcobinamide-phosphate guanylyltransferase [Reichenbachiella versicolor]